MDGGTLLTSVLASLQARKGQWRQIANATGLDYSWLTKLGQGKINDPGVRKIQILSDYMGKGPDTVVDPIAQDPTA